MGYKLISKYGADSRTSVVNARAARKRLALALRAQLFDLSKAAPNKDFEEHLAQEMKLLSDCYALLTSEALELPLTDQQRADQRWLRDLERSMKEPERAVLAPPAPQPIPAPEVVLDGLERRLAKIRQRLARVAA